MTAPERDRQRDRRWGGRGAPKLERDEDRWTRLRGASSAELGQLEHPVRSTAAVTAVWAALLLGVNLFAGRPVGESLLATAFATALFATVWHVVVSDRRARRYRRWLAQQEERT